jgi:hypothetical protein
MTTQTPVPPPPRKTRRWPWIAGLVAALLAGLGIGAAGGETPSADPAPTVTVTAEPEVITETVEGEIPADEITALIKRENAAEEREVELDERESELDEREGEITEAEETKASNTISGNGLYIVGEDIEPGRYRADASDCYWARLASTSTNDIIDNWYESGPTVVDIAESDVAFETSGCGEWVRS